MASRRSHRTSSSPTYSTSIRRVLSACSESRQLTSSTRRCRSKSCSTDSPASCRSSSRRCAITCPTALPRSRRASDAKTDRTEKLPLYAEFGVRHVWLLDPLAQTLALLCQKLFHAAGGVLQGRRDARARRVVGAGVRAVDGAVPWGI